MIDKGIKVYAALFSDVKIVNKNAKLEKLKEESIEVISKSNIKDNPIIQGYKEFYNNKDYLSGSEGLIKIIRNSGRFPNINNVVDSYNLISAKSLISMGAHDISNIKADCF